MKKNRNRNRIPARAAMKFQPAAIEDGVVCLGCEFVQAKERVAAMKEHYANLNKIHPVHRNNPALSKVVSELGELLEHFDKIAIPVMQESGRFHVVAPGDLHH